MAKVKIRFLVEKPNKDGSTTYHWQPSKSAREAGWKAKPLGKDQAAAFAAAIELNKEYDAWRRGEVDLPKVRVPSSQGTVAALAARYRREVMNGTKPNGAPRLKPSTRSVYETALTRIERWAGKHPVAFVTPARVRKLRDANLKPIEQGGLGHAATLNLLKMGRQLFAFGERIDMVPRGSNPFTDFDLGAVPSRRTIWQLEDDAAFDAAARELGYPGFALARELGLFTAQRESDLIAFTEPQFTQLEIFDPRLREMLEDETGTVKGWALDQGKTSDEYSARQMRIPFPPELAQRVEQTIRHNRARDRAMDPPRLMTHVLVNDKTGTPWTSRNFIRIFDKIRAHAAKRTDRPHMLDLWWHDLRRTRVVRLRWQGMSKEMIASITGHDPKSIDEMLKVYGPIDPTVTAAAVVSSLEHEKRTA